MNSYFICATQFTNLGDLIINKMLIDELCKYGKVYIDAFGVPENFRVHLLENKNTVDINKQFNFTVKRLGVCNIWRFIRFYQNHHVELTTRSPGPLCESSEKTRLAFYFINSIARLFKSTVCYIGNCASELEVLGKHFKSENVNSLYLRSFASVNFMRQTFSSQVSYIPDMAFLLKKKVSSSFKEKIVGVDFRPVKGLENESKQKFISIINKYLDSGFRVVLYYQVYGDKDFILDLFNSISHPLLSLREDIVWYDDLSFYADKMFIVSNRLHSLLVGAAFGAMPICIYDDIPQLRKIKEVFSSSFGDKLPILFDSSIEDIVHQSIILWDEFRETLDNLMNQQANIVSDTINKISLSLNS